MRACRACTFRASNPRACQDRTKDGSLDVKQQGATRGQRVDWMPESESALHLAMQLTSRVPSL